jgi:ABC-type multidrug transport system, ATPase component
VLKDLSLWDKKDARSSHVRRHEAPGDDREGAVARAADPVSRRADRGRRRRIAQGHVGSGATLQASGVTIILTTHYIEEAEEMADRIGVINKGEIILVEDKAGLMQKLGRKQLKLHLQGKIDAIPPDLAPYKLELANEGRELIYNYDTKGERTGITSLLSDLRGAGIRIRPRHQQSFAGRHLRQPGEGAMNFRASARSICSKWRAPGARCCKASFRRWFDVAVFRGVRRRDRLAHHPGRGRQLRHLHRAGAGDAVGADAEHRQRLVRHLLSEIRRHHL